MPDGFPKAEEIVVEVMGATNRLEVCRTCRAYFPLPGGDEFECMDGVEMKMHRAVEGGPIQYMCNQYRRGIFYLVPGYAYSPYAVYKLRAFEEECMRCEGMEDESD